MDDKLTCKKKEGIFEAAKRISEKSKLGYNEKKIQTYRLAQELAILIIGKKKSKEDPLSVTCLIELLIKFKNT
jgi:hypothetical protein